MKAMRDLTFCFRDHAVKVSVPSCSSAVGSATVNAVTSVFRCHLASDGKELVIRVTWCKPPAVPPLSVAIAGDEPYLLCRRTGSCTYLSSDGGAVGLHWDVSSANYGPGPEPTNGFFVAVVVDGQLCLLLGDRGKDFAKRLTKPVQAPEPLSREERVVVTGGVGGCRYSTRVRFCEGGDEHEVWMRWEGEKEIEVGVGGKRAVHARRLWWNFRGSHVVFVDGLVVDVMWNLHDWWFAGRPGGCAEFVFRRRSSPEARLWSEEEMASRAGGFCLFIRAFRGY
ncbi:hypothetical protein HPP92_000953 [Vanilla planifolia]|uniref:Uncharacterized protein n=1 Tax=Vanilla planifolia TaxID=51239 RepID=A0A835S6R4_VANPL|nr:hypothetical protein HPP92_001113 [Vanilla planifolia]KAG0500881.1 hypothetical protein HPP92_000953 [Vanilla planifolia]